MDGAPHGPGSGGLDILVAPRGDLNTQEECRPVDQQLQSLVASGAQVIVVDATAIGHLSGTGLRLLLQASRRLRRLGGELVLFGVGPNVRKVLSLSSLDSEFTVADDTQHAWRVVHQRMAAIVKAAPEAPRPTPGPAPEPPAPPTPQAPMAAPPPPAAAEEGRTENDGRDTTEELPTRLNLMAELVLQALGASDAAMASALPLLPDRQAALDEMGKRIENVCADRRL
jgi:anti-anti-sigma factor